MEARPHPPQVPWHLGVSRKRSAATDPSQSLSKLAAMDASPPQPLAGFEPLQRIGDNLYLHETPGSPEPNPGPSLIIVFTWLGGSTSRRIQKYLAGYRCLWPGAAILLVATRMLEFTALPFRALHARLAPAREAIRRRLGGNPPAQTSASVLLHIFSNGGLYTAVHLALSLRHPHRARQPLDLGPHIRGIILDCCPGQTEFRRTYKAGAVALPPTLPARLLGKPLLFLAAGLFTNLTHAGLTSGVRHLRRQLNDPAVFGSSARRLYLYSKADPIVGWEDVESHMEQAASAKGYAVEGVAFPDSPHCALVRSNEVRYWDAIGGFWDRARVQLPGNNSLSDCMPANTPRSRL